MRERANFGLTGIKQCHTSWQPATLLANPFCNRLVHTKTKLNLQLWVRPITIKVYQVLCISFRTKNVAERTQPPNLGLLWTIWTNTTLTFLLWWHYSPMQTFTSWMDFSQWALFFDLFFQFVILHVLISVGTQFHHLFFGHSLSQLPWGWMLKYFTDFSFTFHSVKMTNPIQLAYWQMKVYLNLQTAALILYYHFLQFSFTSIPANILLKIFFWKQPAI